MFLDAQEESASSSCHIFKLLSSTPQRSFNRDKFSTVHALELKQLELNLSKKFVAGVSMITWFMLQTVVIPDWSHHKNNAMCQLGRHVEDEIVAQGGVLNDCTTNRPRQSF